MRALIILTLVVFAAAVNTDPIEELEQLFETLIQDRDVNAELAAKLIGVECDMLSTAKKLTCVTSGPWCDFVNALLNIQKCSGADGKTTSMDGLVSKMKDVGCKTLSAVKVVVCPISKKICNIRDYASEILKC